VSALDETQHERSTAADTVAGLLAVASIVLSGIAMGFGLLLQLDARPARIAPVAVILALVAARMSARFQSLALKAALFAAFAWVVGMTVAVVTDGPLL
jgi:FtsH-binding integral membrane protein